MYNQPSKLSKKDNLLLTIGLVFMWTLVIVLFSWILFAQVYLPLAVYLKFLK